MSGTNDFLPYSTAVGANVVDQATYAGSTYVPIGRGAGILPSDIYNKIARQSSVGTFLLGQIICDVLGINAADDGNTALLLANLKTALATLITPTGRIRAMMDVSAATGWVPLNDGTVGNAGSGGTTRANADTLALYTMMWNNISNSFCPVSGGRGGSAAADFAALKTIGLPATLGRALATAGAGSGLTSRALGSSLGEETHIMTLSELVSHNHAPLSGSGFYTVGTGTNPVNPGIAQSTGNATTANTGSSTAFNQMQPSTFYNMEVKL